MMKTVIKILSITGSLLLCGVAQAQPYNRTLPAVVNDNNGNIFWCDAHRQVTGKCKAMSLNRNGGMVIVRSSPFKDCAGGLWGWISIMHNDVSKGFTITPDPKFGVSVKDLCRPETVVTYMPNQKKPEYDDLVALYQGKELFRYQRF